MAQPIFRKTILAFCLGFFSVIYPQETGNLTGKVVDGQSFKTINGVVVSVQNTSFTQLTNPSGVFDFTMVPIGNHLLKIEHTGYQSQLIPISIESHKTTDLGIVFLIESLENQANAHLVSLSEDDLNEESPQNQSIIFLNSNRDAFQKAAAFNFSPFRFRWRGLDNAYAPVLLNGLDMNAFKDGRPQWNQWGGLNDIIRNPIISNGSQANEYAFGNIGGVQHFNLGPSAFKSGTRVSAATSNTHFNHRLMVTHASGISKKGWSYVISASKRWADEAYFEGTFFDAQALFLGIEKILNPEHRLYLTAIGSMVSRGLNSSNTQEVTNLAGISYNSFWGFQNGKKRNSRVRNQEEPLFILSHDWEIDEKTKLQSNLSYQWGSLSITRLDFNKANNPDPSYYKNLPSFYLNAFDADNNHTPNSMQAQWAEEHFKSNAQINWADLYAANLRHNHQGESVYALVADQNYNQHWRASSIFYKQIHSNIQWQSGIQFKKLKTENFRRLIDLLGGTYYTDTDAFLYGNQAQPNLLTPNRKAVEENRIRYNYNTYALSAEIHNQKQLQLNRWELYLAQVFNYTQYQREGLYQNGLYPNESLGKSPTISFENIGGKMGVLYKHNGFHFFEMNGQALGKAPYLQNTFSNARLNNRIVNDIKSEWIVGGDASYYYRSSELKARLTGYFSSIKNSTNIAYYYTEGLGIFNQYQNTEGVFPNAFVSEITTGMNKTNLGIEISLDYKISPVLQANAACNLGQYTYSNNPWLYVNIDNLQTEIDLGKSYLKNYKQGGMPQHAYSVGLSYRNPNYWWSAINFNYLTHNYLNINPLLRTDNFLMNPEDISGFPFPEASENQARNLLKQERLNDVFTINLIGGKTWKIKEQTLGVFVAFNNLLNHQYKIGGYEQARNANFRQRNQDVSSGTPNFGNKYFYGYGRTYFVNLYLNL